MIIGLKAHHAAEIKPGMQCWAARGDFMPCVKTTYNDFMVDFTTEGEFTEATMDCDYAKTQPGGRTEEMLFRGKKCVPIPD